MGDWTLLIIPIILIYIPGLTKKNYVRHGVPRRELGKAEVDRSMESVSQQEDASRYVILTANLRLCLYNFIVCPPNNTNNNIIIIKNDNSITVLSFMGFHNRKRIDTINILDDFIDTWSWSELEMVSNLNGSNRFNLHTDSELTPLGQEEQ